MLATSTIKNVISKLKSSIPISGHVHRMSREEMISIIAYHRAEQRCFVGGDPVADWLAAEAAVDAMFSNPQISTFH